MKQFSKFNVNEKKQVSTPEESLVEIARLLNKSGWAHNDKDPNETFYTVRDIVREFLKMKTGLKEIGKSVSKSLYN